MLCASVLGGRDFYRLLGVKRTATSQQIKQAYRKLSLKWHPDKNQESEAHAKKAEKKFIEISDAYQVLSDKQQRAKYDKFGEEGLKEGGRRGPGGRNPFDMFKTFFGGGRGGGPKGGMPGGRSRGYGGDGPDLFGSDVPDLQELVKSTYKALMDEEKERRSVVILFYQPKCKQCEGLKEAFKELGEKFHGGGMELVKVAAVNCGRRGNLCGATTSLPTVLYYGPGEEPKKYEGEVNYKGVSNWLPKVMTDYTISISSVQQLMEWLRSDDRMPKVALVTDRKSVPPIMKALSVEFRGRASLGVVLAGAEPEVAENLKTTAKPALLHVLDEDSLETCKYDKDFKREPMARFLTKAVGKHRARADATLRELTAARLRNGDCASNDASFCLLLLESGKSHEAHPALRQLAVRLKQDPVKVFFVRHASATKLFGVQPGNIVLFRPKRKRFKVFEGDTTSLAELLAFAESAIVLGMPLPMTLSSDFRLDVQGHSLDEL